MQDSLVLGVFEREKLLFFKLELHSALRLFNARFD